MHARQVWLRVKLLPGDGRQVATCKHQVPGNAACSIRFSCGPFWVVGFKCAYSKPGISLPGCLFAFDLGPLEVGAGAFSLPKQHYGKVAPSRIPRDKYHTQAARLAAVFALELAHRLPAKWHVGLNPVQRSRLPTAMATQQPAR